MPEPRPIILDSTGLTISDTELACLLSHIEITPDVSTVEIKTMCGTIDYPGAVKWSLVATLYQSFDPDGTEEVLSAAVAGGVAVPFEVIANRTQPVSATNPSYSGDVVPQPYSPLNADAGDASTVELEWAIVGEPVKSITPEAAAGVGVGTGAAYTWQGSAWSRDEVTEGTPPVGTPSNVEGEAVEPEPEGEPAPA